ncbi:MULTISPECIES: hypothetical protein [Streptomyces violaceusniger group]|uniref:Uncharacterized protein n=2 Tax=Streptomyces rhizosphaericus TaxID=114699 RepID=A0ABN1SCH8_9ACTN|nr:MULTISPECIES: hypothetical protein [Streptomyces violaceusniger group]
MSHILPSGPTPADEPEFRTRPDAGVGDLEDPARQEECCPLRAWGCTASADGSTWRLLSAHSTSCGEVEYCKCDCNAIVILCQDEVTALTGLPSNGTQRKP